MIGDESRSLREGVVLAWGRRGSVALATELSRAVEALGVDPDAPWKKLPASDRESILYGRAPVEPAAGHDTAAGATGRRGRGRRAKDYVGIVPRLAARLASAGSGDGAAERADDVDDPDESEGGIGDDEIGRFTTTRVCDVCKVGGSVPKRSP